MLGYIVNMNGRNFQNADIRDRERLGDHDLFE